MYEISLGDFGRMMFEMTVGEQQNDRPTHWESIQAEAEPLVRQLLALNDKMVNEPGIQGYKITGVVVNGKKVLSDYQRIKEAQKRLWGVKIEDLKEGDWVWIEDGDIEIPVGDPALEVIVVSKKGVFVDWGRNGTYNLGTASHSYGTVFRGPEDCLDEDKELNEPYTSKDYWLEQADKLGI